VTAPAGPDAAGIRPGSDPADPPFCRLCDRPQGESAQGLCRRCRLEQRRLFWLEAAGAGFFFAALASLLYLLGRLFAG
jgi:hypothetical protein